MLNFIKNWTLPIAMLAGVLGYLLFVHVPLLEPTKSLVNQLIAFLTPSLIFAQLLLTFCKVNVWVFIAGALAWLVTLVSDNLLSADGSCFIVE